MSDAADRASRPWRSRSALVLADSSIVVLALPEIYRELDTSVAGGHLGAGLLQPRDGARRRARRAARAPGRARAGPPRSGWPSSPAPASPAASPTELEHPDRRPLRAGARRRRRGHRGAGAAAGDGRLRAPRGDASGRPPARPARRSGRRSAACSPSSSPGSRSSCSRCRWRSLAGGADPRRRPARGGDRDVIDRSCARPAGPHLLGQPRAGAGLGGDRGGALPARPAADRGLAADARSGRRSSSR